MAGAREGRERASAGFNGSGSAQNERMKEEAAEVSVDAMHNKQQGPTSEKRGRNDERAIDNCD